MNSNNSRRGRLSALVKVRESARHLAASGVVVDGTAVALAYWVSDPLEGQLLSRFRESCEAQSECLAAVHLGIVYEQWDSDFGSDATWDRLGGDEFVRFHAAEQDARQQGMVVTQIPVEPEKLCDFLQDFGLPKPSIAQLCLLLNDISMTELTTSRFAVARAACGDVEVIMPVPSGVNRARSHLHTTVRHNIH